MISKIPYTTGPNTQQPESNRVSKMSEQEQKSMPGGLTGARPADEGIQAIADEMRGRVEEKLGRALAEYKAVSYATQVVAGVNYFIKVQVSSTECVHIRVYQDLQQHRSLTAVQDGKTLDDPITYF